MPVWKTEANAGVVTLLTMDDLPIVMRAICLALATHLKYAAVLGESMFIANQTDLRPPRLLLLPLVLLRLVLHGPQWDVIRKFSL